MIVLRYKGKEDHAELLKKVKKMERVSSELADILEECVAETEYDDDEYEHEYRGRANMRRGGRYGYRGY